MLKQICIITVIILLTLCLTSCKTTEEAHLKGEVVTINELCKSLQSHIELFKAYKKDEEVANKLYYTLLFHGECIVFKTPVLAKRLEKVFSEKINDNFRLDVWKIILTEEIEEGKGLLYFYTADAEPITQDDDLSV
jgi:broad-specificity NMP kinase|tara:strand:- start:68 stop:475 length:408 start_codon:yes stop_codon:yes gene_type:complete